MSENRVAAGETVELIGVVATSGVFDVNGDGTVRGLFVSDREVQPYSGVLVTFTAEQAFTADLGELVDVRGTIEEFSIEAPGSETRVVASEVVARGANVELTPLVVDRTDELRDETLGEPFEGTLVRIESVEVEAVMAFGQFEVTGDLIVDDTIFRYEPVVGELLNSVTGVVSYNVFDGGGFRLLPRGLEDVNSAERPIASIPQLRDPDHPSAIPACDTFNDDCVAPVVVVEGMVVTTPTFCVADCRNDSPLFGFYIADPSALDADGRMTPFSGVLVTIREGFQTQNDYSFAHDNGTPDPSAAPEVGDVVSLTAENQLFFGNPQLARPTELLKDGTTGGLGIRDPRPARFDPTLPPDNARHPNRLKGGRPAVTPQTGGTTLAAIDPDPAAASWLGAMVEMVNVRTETACVGAPFIASDGDVAHLRDFGAWQVTGDVEIGDQFGLEQPFGGFWETVPFSSANRVCTNVQNKCEDSREANQLFTSLSGVVSVSFDILRVHPRTEDDLQPPSLFANANSGNCQ